MAQTYNIPGQNLSFNLPDVGELFRGVGDQGNYLYKRNGNQIQEIDLVKNYLGADLGKQGSGYGSQGEANAAAIAKLQSGMGIDYNKLGAYNIGDISGAISRLGGNLSRSTDISGFTQTPFTPTNSVYTQGVSAGNPNQAIISGPGFSAQATQPDTNNYNQFSQLNPQQLQQLNQSEAQLREQKRQLQLVSDLQAQGYSPEKAQSIATQAIQAGGIPSDLSSLLGKSAPTVPTTTTVAGLSGTGNIQVPTVSTGNSMQSFVAGLGPVISGTPTAIEQTQSELTKRIQDALSATEGQGAALSSAESAAGIPGQQQALQQVNLQMAQLKAEFDAQNQAIAQQKIPLENITGQQAEAQKLAAIKLGGLAAISQAMQGNISVAEDIVKKSIDLKYADAEQKVNNLKTLLDLNTSQLNREEKKQADALQVILNNQKQAIADQKQEDAQIQAIQLAAAQNGASPSVISAIGQSKSSQAALVAAGGSLNKPSPATLGTAAQNTVAEYAARIEQAAPTIDNLAKTIQGTNFVKFNAELALPTALQSSNVQQFMQASRNFINAKLRRESGAVISPTEFSEARLQYLPQPGDDNKTLELKKQNRDLVFASLKKASGPAYSSVNELLGTQNSSSGGASQADSDYVRSLNLK